VKPSKNSLLFLLALTTMGGALLAWRQYQELIELRAAALKKDERADLQKQIWALGKANRELEDQLAALHTANGGDDAAGAATTDPRGNNNSRADRANRGNRGDPQQAFVALRDLMQKPEVQALLNTQQKAVIDARYAALFKNLNLPPEQLDKLKTLLAERQTTVSDVFTAARDQGIDPRSDPEGFRKLVTDAQNQINDQIKSAIGESGFAQLTNYEQTLPQRNLVNELQQRLSYTDTPLTSSQADALVAILAANAPKAQAGANSAASQPNLDPQGGRLRVGFGGGGGGGGFAAIAGFAGGPGGGMLGAVMEGVSRGANSAPITQNAVAQSTAVLSPPQVQALQQIQQQQQSQQQLQQLVHDTLAANQPASSTVKPGGGTNNGTNAGATGGGGRRRGGGGG